MRQFEQVQRMQDDYTSRILRLLEPMTGPGRVSAQVSVDMDFTVVEEARVRRRKPGPEGKIQ